MMRLAARFTALSVIAIGAAGCPRKGPVSVPPSSEAMLQKMKQQTRCVNGVFEVSKLDSFSKNEGRIRGQVEVFAVNPNRVRFEVVSPFGASIYTLTSNGEEFQMLDKEHNRFLEGPPTACNLARLTKVPIPPHALVTLLRGEAPLLVHTPQQTRYEWDPGGFYKVLVVSNNNAKQEIHLAVHPDDFEKPWAQQRLRVKRVVVTQAGVELYEADLDNHEPAQTAARREDPDGVWEPIEPIGGACSAELPRSLRVRVPHTGQDLILQVKDAKWNPPLIPGTFSQPIPGGVRRERVECSDTK